MKIKKEINIFLFFMESRKNKKYSKKKRNKTRKKIILGVVCVLDLYK
jgi:hypothetical protein